jgi:thioredoxin 1
MVMNTAFATTEPARAEIDALQEATVVEFGAPWCEHCRAAQAPLAAAFAGHAQVRHLKIEDGPGRRLGRSFRVKLWPTLIFLSRGQEVARLVRPTLASEIEAALAKIDVAG